MSDVLAGQAAGIVTNPVAKERALSIGIRRAGHTEFSCKLVRGSDRKSQPPGDDALVAGACRRAGDDPLAAQDVVSNLTFELVVETGRIAAHDLTKRFGILRPRLASLDLTRMPAKMAHLVRKMLQLSRRPSNVCAPKGSMLLALFPPTRSFTNGRERPTMFALCMYHDRR